MIIDEYLTLPSGHTIRVQFDPISPFRLWFLTSLFGAVGALEYVVKEVWLEPDDIDFRYVTLEDQKFIFEYVMEKSRDANHE